MESSNRSWMNWKNSTTKKHRYKLSQWRCSSPFTYTHTDAMSVAFICLLARFVIATNRLYNTCLMHNQQTLLWTRIGSTWDSINWTLWINLCRSWALLWWNFTKIAITNKATTWLRCNERERVWIIWVYIQKQFKIDSMGYQFEKLSTAHSHNSMGDSVNPKHFLASLVFVLKLLPFSPFMGWHS